MNVLIAEDDPHTRDGLADILRREGYDVITAADGAEALVCFSRARPDLVCLDIMMPGKDGYTVCREIRAADAEVPIIFLSAKGEEIDKVVGLELGADDFIVKPFGVREVVARIRAVTRRCLAARSRGSAASPTVEPPFVFGDLRVIPAELRVRRGDEVIDVSLRDIRLLSLFARHPGKVLTRYEISTACWDAEHLPTSRTLDQHISQLRKRIERDPHEPRLILTVHGVGYRHDPLEIRGGFP